MNDKTSLRPITRLVEALRGKNGCPWDREQTPETLSIYLIEEMYELVDAIENGSPETVCEELGDVLFHIVFLSHLFKEKGHFDLGDVIGRNAGKMVGRHPHVFGDATVRNADEVRERWNEIKRTENKLDKEGSILSSVPEKLPALMRAYRISERAAGADFDWEDISGVMTQAEEEWKEFKAARDPGAVQTEESEDLEFGDVLFTLVNVARFARIHPETALRRSIGKFEQRFRYMEQAAADRGTTFEDIPRDEKEQLWEEAKQEKG